MSDTAEVIGSDTADTGGNAAAEPTGDEQSAETGEQGAGESESSESTRGRSGAEGDDALVREGDIAGDYLEQLLDILDYDGDIDLDVEADRAIVSIDGGDDVERLVGSEGTVLEALQELARSAVQQQTGERSRLMLDIAGWREGRRTELRELGRSTAESVVESGEKARLQPMSPFERKVVHDAVAAVSGATSASEGEAPNRRVVIIPEA